MSYLLPFSLSCTGVTPLKEASEAIEMMLNDLSDMAVLGERDIFLGDSFYLLRTSSC